MLWREGGVALCVAIVFFLMPAVTFSSFILSTDILLVFFWILGMIQILKIRKIDFNPSKLLENISSLETTVETEALSFEKEQQLMKRIRELYLL